MIHKSRGLSPSGVSCSPSLKDKSLGIVTDSSVSNLSINSSCSGNQVQSIKGRRKSGSKLSVPDPLLGSDIDSFYPANSSLKSSTSASSVKSRKSSCSSVISLTSSESLLANCEKCRKTKKSLKDNPRSTSSWTVSDSLLTEKRLDKVYKSPSTSVSSSSVSKSSSEVFSVPLKQCLRASTQAQSRAEVGTYRVSRKRSNKTVTSSEPVPKVTKRESQVDADLNKGKEVCVVELNRTYISLGNAASSSFNNCSAKPGSSTKTLKTKDTVACNDLNWVKDKKSKRKDKHLKKETKTGESSSGLEPPGLNSLRRKTRGKKTGSCASSRLALMAQAKLYVHLFHSN